jgi:hypothetical protein
MLTRNFKNRRRDLAGSLYTCSAHNSALSGRNKVSGIVFYRKRDAMEQVTKERAGASRNVGNNKAVEIASRIEAMPIGQVRELYHELVDKKPILSSTERFEFERVRARLDAEDFDAEQEARNRAWERRQKEVLDSIEDLLDRLRASHLG